VLQLQHVWSQHVWSQHVPAPQPQSAEHVSQFSLNQLSHTPLPHPPEILTKPFILVMFKVDWLEPEDFEILNTLTLLVMMATPTLLLSVETGQKTSTLLPVAFMLK
jgi:hypothetical protein